MISDLGNEQGRLCEIIAEKLTGIKYAI